jgi:hypothetical protein
MKPDPRACRAPFPFIDHLTLAETWEYESLAFLERRGKWLNAEDRARLKLLKQRKYVPPEPSEAA